MGRYAGSQEANRYLPSDGLHVAVFVDYELLPNQETEWGTKDLIRYYFLLDEYGEDRKPILISKRFTDKLYVPKKGKMAPGQYSFLSDWRGKPMTKDEIDVFDQEHLIGINAQMVTQVKTYDDGSQWAHIVAIMPAKANGTQLTIPKDFVRKKDRPADTSNPSSAPPPQAQRGDLEAGHDDDIPF
jgi:hypothetical protein